MIFTKFIPFGLLGESSKWYHLHGKISGKIPSIGSSGCPFHGWMRTGALAS
jgi:hypothetical protein